MGMTSRQKMMVIVLLSGAVLAVLNQTLLSPALPVIMTDLGIQATTVQWLTSGYSMIEAIIIPLNAFLIGRFSTRKLFIGGMSLFAIGSLVSAISPAFPILLLGRMIQATATGIVMPMVFTVILLVFPREKRGAAMGIVGLVISFAPAIGPVVSGLLVDNIGWRALFVIVTALSVLVVVFAIFSLQNSKEFARVPLDVLSVLLIALGIVPLLYGLSSFTSSENPLVPVAMILVGLVFLGLFGWRQTRLEHPLLRVRVLLSRRFRATVILMSILEAVLIGNSVILPLYIQGTLGYSPTISGFALLPGAAIGAAAGLFAGRMYDRYGVRGIAIAGSVLMVVAGLCYVFVFSADTNIIIVATVGALLGIAVQMLFTPMNTWGINSLGNEVVQHANALSNTTNQIGASFGTAFIVSLSALGGVYAPGATGAELSFAGNHVAFLGIFALMCIVFIGIFINAKNVEGDLIRPRPKFDILKGRPGWDRDWYVDDIMDRIPSFVNTAASIKEAIKVISEKETSGIPVVDENNVVVGFLSDGDIIKYLARGDIHGNNGVDLFNIADDEKLQDRLERLLQLNVMDLATKRVVTVDGLEEADRAFALFSNNRIKKVPVVDNEGHLVGSLSRRNIMKVLATA